MSDQEPGTRRAAADPDLARRVVRLERILIGAYALVTAALLLGGLTVPFFTSRDTRGDSHVDTPVSVAVVLFKPGMAPADSGEDATLSALFMTGFAGLFGVVVLLLILVALAAFRALRTPLRRIGWALVALGIIGAFVLLSFTLKAASNHVPDTPGWGAVVLLLGLLAIVPLLTRKAAPLVAPHSPGSTAP